MSFFNGSINSLTLKGGNLLTDSLNSGNINVAGTTNLAGDINIAGNLNVVGISIINELETTNHTIHNNLQVDNNVNITGTSSLQGASTVASTLNVCGLLTVNNIQLNGSISGNGAPTSILPNINIPNSSGNISVTPSLSTGDSSYNIFTFTPTNTGLFIIQIPQIYSNTNTASTSPLYETRMVVYDASGVIATDSRFFTLNNYNKDSSTNGGTWSGSLCCFTNIANLKQKFVKIYLSAGQGIAKLGRVQWSAINIMPLQSNLSGSSTFVQFP